MKFTLSWLKTHLETEASLDDILYAPCAWLKPMKATSKSCAARLMRVQGSRSCLPSLGTMCPALM